MHRLARTLALSTAALLACAGQTAPKLASPPLAQGTLRAGAAKLDITPLPGLPLGAHSIEGGTGLARWTRLWARAIYVEDAQGEPLVLVACDLWSIPAGLGDAIVDRLHDHHGLDQLDRRHLLLAATHTHHGPAAFASNRLYNRAAGPRMGFDPELHEFLVRRIADAIAQAVLSAEPAALRLERSTLGAMARNRSLAPFRENPEAGALIEANAELPACHASEPEACRAIDPTLTTLRIDDAQGEAIAVAAFFAVHATAMRNATDAYHGDISTIATFEAEQALAAASGHEGVVALFNGAEGDVSPDWPAQGRASTLALGERLGAAIVATAGLGSDCASGLPITGTITNRFSFVAMADQPVAGPEQARTAARALPGKAILGGAEDGRTRYHRRWPEGQTVARSRRAGQGPKKPAVPPILFSIGFPSWTLVAHVPVSLHRLGPLALAGLPGEFTTVMGMRIRSDVRRASEEPILPIVVGLADEYAGYFVTPQEYALQHYEGASTLWGQYAAAFVQQSIAGLVARDPGPPTRARFDPGVRKHFALQPGDGRALRDLDERLATQLELDTEPFSLRFDSAPPSWLGPTWPTISVELREIAGGSWREFADDRGPEFVVFPEQLERERWRWQAWWLAAPPAGMQARLRVFTSEGTEVCSAAFSATDTRTLALAPCAPAFEPERADETAPGLIVP